MCCFYASSFKASSVSFYPMEKNKNFLNSLCYVLIFVLSLSVFSGSCSCFDRCNLGLQRAYLRKLGVKLLQASAWWSFTKLFLVVYVFNGRQRKPEQ